MQMVNKSNIVILVPTGNCPEYPAEFVLIWDDKKPGVALKVDFHEPIKGLNLTNSIYLVVK